MVNQKARTGVDIIDEFSHSKKDATENFGIKNTEGNKKK